MTGVCYTDGSSYRAFSKILTRLSFHKSEKFLIAGIHARAHYTTVHIPRDQTPSS